MQSFAFLGVDEMNFSKREVRQPEDSDIIKVVYAFDVARVHVSDSL